MKLRDITLKRLCAIILSLALMLGTIVASVSIKMVKSMHLV